MFIQLLSAVIRAAGHHDKEMQFTLMFIFKTQSETEYWIYSCALAALEHAFKPFYQEMIWWPYDLHYGILKSWYLIFIGDVSLSETG